MKIGPYLFSKCILLFVLWTIYPCTFQFVLDVFILAIYMVTLYFTVPLLHVVTIVITINYVVST